MKTVEIIYENGTVTTITGIRAEAVGEVERDLRNSPNVSDWHWVN